MSGVQLPNRIYGKWIWREELLNQPDSFVLMRKEFTCSFAGLDTTLWISANSSYQLFINGRFVGFGPRAHQVEGTSYIDAHDIGFYLESGINVLAVLVYYSVDADRRAPGLWCQMATATGEVLCSDESWLTCSGHCFTGPRARLSPGQGMAQVFHSDLCPRRWTMPIFMPDNTWTHPTHVASVDEFGTTLELHPLAPPAVNDERFALTPVESGKVSSIPNWSAVQFRNVPCGNPHTYAAAGCLFAERDHELEVKIFSDNPFKLYCNRQLVISAARRQGESGDVLQLRRGWNRLLLIQTPECNAMGMLMLFPDTPEGHAAMILQDTVDNAAPGWNLCGPLKLTLAEASSSLSFARLKVRSCHQELAAIADPDSLLNSATLVPADDAGGPLGNLEYRVFRLDVMRYGFLRVKLEASSGDIVDIGVGLRRGPNGMVRPTEAARCVGTLFCRGGRNTYISLLPSDCLYVILIVRRASGKIKINQVEFNELVRMERHECKFKCSEKLLNEFWQIGRQTLRRSAAYVSPADARPDYDCYMLDAYIDAVNMAAVFGDGQYATARLRQFLAAQLENGDIPALTNGKRRASQIHHLFFLPLWMFYNYRFTADLVELKRSLPALDMLREYFEAMVDEKTGLLCDVEQRFRLYSRLSEGKFPENELPTYLNSLFCRFLLSAAEIYQIVEQQGEAEHAIKLARKVAAALWDKCFDPDKQLFLRWSRNSAVPPDCNLFANFCSLFSGVLEPEEYFERFFFKFFNYDPPYDRSEEAKSPYFHFLFMEMMFAFGQRDWAYDYFVDYWKRRISPDTGSWRAAPDDDSPSPTRFSDGSCVSPNIFLIREVLGIRIAEPGHSIVYFNPAQSHLEWAEGSIAMSRGRLLVKWRHQSDGSLEVEMDSSLPIKVITELTEEELSNTSFQLSDNITLMQMSSQDR